MALYVRSAVDGSAVLVAGSIPGTPCVCKALIFGCLFKVMNVASPRTVNRRQLV